MPRGKLGFKRLTDLGPLVDKEDHEKTFLYRGADIESMRHFLSGGEIEGSKCNILSTSPVDKNADLKHENFRDIDWVGDVNQGFHTVTVTGGVSDYIPSTRRFRDSNGLVAVMDSSDLPFEKVRYEYDWMNKNPGALCHILTTQNIELRPDSKLWGLAASRPSARGGEYHVIEHWGPNSLPATNPDSKFADEREWIAPTGSVKISKGIEGVISLKTTRSVSIRAKSVFDDIEEMLPPEEVADRVYSHLYKEIGRPKHPFVMMLFDNSVPDKQFYDGSDVSMVIYNGERVDIEEIPTRFRGNL